LNDSEDHVLLGEFSDGMTNGYVRVIKKQNGIIDGYAVNNTNFGVVTVITNIGV
jgi:hypothetical protein